jgi:methylmalonyl-CoA/ethylmalonyl-CoA epimerase
MRLAQVGQHADDLDRAAAFYAELLGSPPSGRFDPPGLLFFDLDGVRLLLERGLPSATVYLGVDDVHAALDRVRDQVEVVTEPHVIFHHEDDRLGPAGSDEWHAFIRDTEGNLVGLVGWTPR